MSVKQHEAFCFDSFQDMLLWFDDFHGDQLQDEWDTTLTGGGTVVVVDQQTGGIVRLAAPLVGTADAAQIDWNDIRSLLVTKRVTFESRSKLSANTQIRVSLALYNAGNDFIDFYYSQAAAGNWRIRCSAAGAPTNLDSGIAADTDYHIFRIECFPTGEVHFYIDGVETTNSPITTNIPALYLMPYFRCKTLEAALKQLDVDYCYVRQER